ncbi:MAG: hypothetical protein ON057_000020 [Glomeribacter sp. 1016415]|nr:hypothetical protein [Glomeribacter sp. 1016415]
MRQLKPFSSSRFGAGYMSQMFFFILISLAAQPLYEIEPSFNQSDMMAESYGCTDGRGEQPWSFSENATSFFLRALLNARRECP